MPDQEGSSSGRHGSSSGRHGSSSGRQTGFNQVLTVGSLPKCTCLQNCPSFGPPKTGMRQLLGRVRVLLKQNQFDFLES